MISSRYYIYFHADIYIFRFNFIYLDTSIKWYTSCWLNEASTHGSIGTIGTSGSVKPVDRLSPQSQSLHDFVGRKKGWRFEDASCTLGCFLEGFHRVFHRFSTGFSTLRSATFHFRFHYCVLNGQAEWMSSELWWQTQNVFVFILSWVPVQGVDSCLWKPLSRRVSKKPVPQSKLVFLPYLVRILVLFLST